MDLIGRYCKCIKRGVEGIPLGSLCVIERVNCSTGKIVGVKLLSADVSRWVLVDHFMVIDPTPHNDIA